MSVFYFRLTHAAAALLYLCVIVLTSLWAGLVPSLVISVIAILCLDYFFTSPLFSMQVGEVDAVALIVFSTTAVVITQLMSRVRKSFEEIQALQGELRAGSSTRSPHWSGRRCRTAPVISSVDAGSNTRASRYEGRTGLGLDRRHSSRQPGRVRGPVEGSPWRRESRSRLKCACGAPTGSIAGS